MPADRAGQVKQACGALLHQLLDVALLDRQGCLSILESCPSFALISMPRPSDRPTKVCPVCGRPFQWRKKWKAIWDEVRYCSDRCRRRKSSVSTDA